MRRRYIEKFIFRLVVLGFIIFEYAVDAASFEVLKGMNFFRHFSLFHIIWVIWMADMIQQLIPAKGVLTIGSQKQFLLHFIPSNISKTKDELKKFIAVSGYAKLKVFVIWVLLVTALGLLKMQGVIGAREILVIITLMYVADLICVLFWCPFRVFFLKNRCCTTCTIFNWDHIMMFSPGIFVFGFFTWSLFVMSAIVFILWEVYFFIHPERFWEETNIALKCENCTEELCGKRLHVQSFKA